jgi:hypothetical protein
MKIKNGGTRTVFIIGGYVVKIPHFMMTIESTFTFLVSKFGFTEKQRRLAKCDFNYCSTFVLDGLWGNKEEFRTYNETQASFLPKSYFTLFRNFILLQKRVDGEPIWFDEVKSLLGQLPQDQFDIIFTRKFDLHSFSNGDWIKTSEGIMICDYGGKGVSNTDFFSFLVNNKNDLERILKAQ